MISLSWHRKASSMWTTPKESMVIAIYSPITEFHSENKAWNDWRNEWSAVKTSKWASQQTFHIWSLAPFTKGWKLHPVSPIDSNYLSLSLFISLDDKSMSVDPIYEIRKPNISNWWMCMAPQQHSGKPAVFRSRTNWQNDEVQTGNVST
jgi:hypothetical protein